MSLNVPGKTSLIKLFFLQNISKLDKNILNIFTKIKKVFCGEIFTVDF